MRKKGIFLILLTFIFLLSSGVTAQIPEEKIQDLLEDTELLGYVSSDNDMITRAEFVQLAAKLMPLTSYEQASSAVPFLDVPREHTAYHEIAVLYDLGIVKGEENAQFFPDKNIILRDACTILVRIMGYEYQMEKESDALMIAKDSLNCSISTFSISYPEILFCSVAGC